jgi:hypothetical protein
MGQRSAHDIFGSMTSSCCSDPYHAAQKNINENTLAENEARCNALKLDLLCISHPSQ